VFLLNLRPEGAVMKFLTCCAWLVNLPFLLFSSLVGTWVFLHAWKTSAMCLPPSRAHVLFAVTWEVLGFLWVLMHVRLAATAIRIEVQLRRTEAELRVLEVDSDVIARWGRVSMLGSFTSLEDSPQLKGLSAQEIASLPSSRVEMTPGDDEVCSICVDSFAEGDCVRCLNTCGHTFHQSCIDLWLLRQADCPLCKRTVSAVSACKSCEP